MQTLEQLRAEATSLGLRVHHKHSEDTLREMIAGELENNVVTEEAAQKDKPVRVLMYRNNGEKLWVMNDDVRAYEAQGWHVV